ncbi:hypothetical protein QE392_001399 [Microbacterium proteolyticum]|uniref:hypothetical protein n=1 Tax=Microbacterium proteolyticum TaxID=1572644 RepID=UPI00277E01CB|nr:hypothetical protein [Microbacterium proteolyticum]MDQ1169595.1 hypothetical protein [Microbacterium proteolyticum]
MGGAPTIVWLRPGVGYTAPAAASMRRLERALGREHDCNSSYRDYDEQMRMYNAWQRYVNSGYNPRYKPNHSRAIHPDTSEHCAGIADDSDDWTTPGYIDLAAEHGWIRTAAWDPTEQHHFTYQWWKDQHRNDPEPTTVEPATVEPAEEPPIKKRKLTMHEALIVHEPTNALLIVNVRERTLISLGKDPNSMLRAWYAENHPWKFMGGEEWDRTFGKGSGYSYVGHGTPAPE